MTTPYEQTTAHGLDANPDDPWLGVHALTEFLYCPRAGLVAFESRVDDLGEEQRPGRLDYLPRYDLREIENRLARSLKQLAFLAGGLLLAAAFTVALMAAWDARVLWAGLMLMGLLFAPTVWVAMENVQLAQRRAIALASVSREPVWASRDEPAPINWWQLRNAGFTAKRYEEPLTDEEWKLAGRPFLVLCRGDLRIPVFRLHHTPEKLHSQHFVRIAAYCHLIEHCTGYQAPYGVILFGRTYQGVALQNFPLARQAFREGLKTARQMVHDSRRGHEPLPPPQSICRKCPIGRPVLYRAGVTETLSEGGVLPVHGSRDAKGKLYHCACGDRFRWLPPHERVREQGLERGTT